MVLETGDQRPDPRIPPWRNHGGIKVRSYFDLQAGIHVHESRLVESPENSRIEDAMNGLRRQANNVGIPEEYKGIFPPSYHVDLQEVGEEKLLQAIDYYPTSEGVALINTITIPHEQGESHLYPRFQVRYDHSGKLIDFGIFIHEPENKPLENSNIPYTHSLREIGGLLRAGADPTLIIPHEEEDLLSHLDDPNFGILLQRGHEIFQDILSEREIEGFIQELYSHALIGARAAGVEVSTSTPQSLEDFFLAQDIDQNLLPFINQKAQEILVEYEKAQGIGDVYELLFQPSENNPRRLIRSIYPNAEERIAYSKVRVPLNVTDSYRFHLYRIVRTENFSFRFKNALDASEKHIVTFPGELPNMADLTAYMTTPHPTDWRKAVPLVPIRHVTEEAA